MRNVRTWIDEILGAVRDELIARHVFPEHLVFCSLDEEQVAPPGDFFGTINPGPQRPIQNVIDGAGNVCPLMTGTIAITAWLRLAIDEHQRDDRFLNDRTFGAYQKFRLLFAALQMFDPKNKAGDEILTEAMRIAAPGFTPRARAESGWGGVRAEYEISWLADLSTPTIPSAVEP